MEAASGGLGPLEADTSNLNSLPADIIERVRTIDLSSQEDGSEIGIQISSEEEISAESAAQLFWDTGVLACKIPNGFYTVIPDKVLKSRFKTIPTVDELFALGPEVANADAILVDLLKDKRLAKLKQFTVASVKRLSSIPMLMIKKIAEVVSDFYGGPLSEESQDEAVSISDKQTPMLLGLVRSRSCRPRAILFKVLADAVGLKSKLLVDLHIHEKEFTQMDSCKHMSLIVTLNSTELLVDLMKSPGQLLPFSAKALLLHHTTGIGEGDSAENDSCDSPLEPNSPIFPVSEKSWNESRQQDDERLPYMDHKKTETLSPTSGHLLPNIKLKPSACFEGKLSFSRSEPDIANGIWRRSRRKVIAEQRTASSSPEHRFMRSRGRSVLGGHRQVFGDDIESVSASSPDQSPQHNATLERSSTVVGRHSPYYIRPDGNDRRRTVSDGKWIGGDFSQLDHKTNLEHRRTRKRSVSIAPEISDDIVRAVRAMNDALKRERIPKAQETLQGESSHLSGEQRRISSNDQSDCVMELAANSGGSNTEKGNDPEVSSAQTSIGTSMVQETCDKSSYSSGDNANRWKEVLQSSANSSKSLLPFPEWHIEFSELRIGVRVGIGSFGEVFRGIWRGTEVAIKVLLEQDLTEENIEDFCHEIELLSRMRHPNVILFLGACTKPPQLCMVTEFMEMGSLYYLIHTSGQGKKLSWRRRLKMLRDICRGMMSIQRMNIVHRDLKSANCLVDKHWTVKICDFGLSRVATDLPIRDSMVAGTPEWMAPELLRNEPFTDKCDVFSLGVIIWELCTLRRPWEGVLPIQVVYAVAHEGVRLDIPDGPIGKLISDCWAEPSDRPSYEEVFTRLHECEFLES